MSKKSTTKSPKLTTTECPQCGPGSLASGYRDAVREIADMIDQPPGLAPSELPALVAKALLATHRVGFGDGYFAATDRLERRSYNLWLLEDDATAVTCRTEAKALREAFGDELEKRFPEQEG